jgi:acetyl esterase/lipase
MNRGLAATRRLLVLAVALPFFAIAPDSSAKPVVLTIHSGGYYMSNAASMASQVASFRAQGFKVESVEYRLGNIRAGWRDVRAAVRRYPRRHVYAYGESAGAGYAGLLATTRLIDGAALQSPLIDLRTFWGPERGHLFACTTRACWERFSAVRKRAKQPVLMFVPLDDPVASPASSLRWERRNRNVRAVAYPGWHGAPSPQGTAADLRRAGRYFWRQHCDAVGCERGG